MTQVLTGATALIPRWLATDDRAQAAWSLAAEIVTSGRRRSGNRATDVGVGVTSGRALATIKDAPTWGGLDYLACDAFPARLDTSTGEIFAVEGYSDADTPGLAPWMLKGEKRNIRRAKGIEGFVARGNEVGDKYARAHVWMRNGELVAHHRKTADSADPPLNSTPVHDPGEGSDDWEAGLHGIMRVRGFPSAFCGGADDKGTAPPDKETPDKFRALLLNFTKSAGDNSGWGSATFSDHEGLLSYEAFGPLTYGAPKHRVGEVDGRETRQGAFDIDRGLFGDRTDAWTAPLLFDRAAWKSGGGRFITDAFIRMDFGDVHQGHCGVKPGKWKPESRCHWNWLPPTYRHPDPEEKDPKKKRPKTKWPPYTNATIDTPDHRLEDSTVNTPDEIQIPSEYGHAKPNIPEADEQRQGVEGDANDPEGMLPTHGYTYEQALRSNVVSHEGFIPQYLSASEATGAGADPNARYPQKTSRIAEITKDESGRIVAYKRGYGPGSKVKLPGNAKVWHALYALKERWPSSFDEHNFIVVAGKNAAGVELVGTLGIGLRAMATVKPAAGWYFKLDYTDGHDVPDLDIRSTDSSGLDASTGRAFKVNGNTVGDVVGPSSAVDNALTRFDGVTGKLIQEGDLVLDDVSGGYALLHTKNNGAGNSNGLRLDVGTATGTAGAIQIGGSNATAVDISKSGVTTTVNGPMVGSNSIKSTSSSAGIGYATGAGGTVTQLTSKTTAVTLDKICGDITMHNAALAAGATAKFTVNNSVLDGTEYVMAQHTSGGTSGAYVVEAYNSSAGGLFQINVTNITTGSLSEAIVIRFIALKGATA